MDFVETAKNIRKEVLEMIYKTKSPHIGSAFSMIEILVVLYFKILNIDPKNPEKEDHDIFILSKGHGCSALYATLAEKGFFEKDLLQQFGINGGIFEGHHTRNLKFGIEVSTGSLGHGLSIGAGMALARKLDNSKSRVFVLLSDGELQEGSSWEAILFASHHKLDNLIAIVDYNKIQALDRIENIINLEPLKEKWESFGWIAKEVNGQNIEEIIRALEVLPFQKDRPSVLIANTKKGAGVSFMENNPLWHSKWPDEEEYKKALKELA